MYGEQSVGEIAGNENFFDEDKVDGTASWKEKILQSGRIPSYMFWEYVYPLSVDYIFDDDLNLVALVSISGTYMSEEQKQKEMLFIKSRYQNIIEDAIYSCIKTKCKVQFDHQIENYLFEKFRVNDRNRNAFERACSIAKLERLGSIPIAFISSREHNKEVMFLLRAIKNYMEQNTPYVPVAYLGNSEFWNTIYDDKHRGEIIHMFDEKIVIIENALYCNNSFVEYTSRALSEVIRHNKETLFIFSCICGTDNVNDFYPCLRKLMNSLEKVYIE